VVFECSSGQFRQTSRPQLILDVPHHKGLPRLHNHFMTKIGLSTHHHTHPYYIQWLNNRGKAKVTLTAHVHFFIGT
jgi:hypothetical protein